MTENGPTGCGADTVTESAERVSPSPVSGSASTSRSVIGQRAAIALPNSVASRVPGARFGSRQNVDALANSTW